MTYPETPLRTAKKTGQHPEAGIVWDGECITQRGHTSSLHRARRPYAEGYVGEDIPDGWREVDFTDATCDTCGAPFDPDADPRRHGSMKWEWNTPSGELEPGCVWINEDAHHGSDHCWSRWTNCDGRHLQVQLPNGIAWDVDGRANNCGLPDDTTHRCWVRVGDPEHPETLHVSKDGETCAAGAGSIAAGDYHGFLQHGKLTAG